MSSNAPYRLIIVWLFSIVLLILCFDAIFPQETNTKTAETELQLSSNELIPARKTKDTLHKYIEGALEIEGVIKKITIRNGIYTLLLEGYDDRHFVICEMQDDQKEHVKYLSIGDNVIIKGIYKGVLVDAILLNCIIVETK